MPTTRFGHPKSCPVLILNDLLNETYSCEVWSVYECHHRNLSVILITQNLFHQGKHCRYISLNVKYLVLLKNVRDKNQFWHFARQVYAENPECLYKTHLESRDRLVTLYWILRKTPVGLSGFEPGSSRLKRQLYWIDRFKTSCSVRESNIRLVGIPYVKCAAVERVHRTIREKLDKYFTH
jgi:hypothetical protein